MRVINFNLKIRQSFPASQGSNDLDHWVLAYHFVPFHFQAFTLSRKVVKLVAFAELHIHKTIMLICIEFDFNMLLA